MIHHVSASMLVIIWGLVLLFLGTWLFGRTLHFDFVHLQFHFHEFKLKSSFWVSRSTDLHGCYVSIQPDYIWCDICILASAFSWQISMICHGTWSAVEIFSVGCMITSTWQVISNILLTWSMDRMLNVNRMKMLHSHAHSILHMQHASSSILLITCNLHGHSIWFYELVVSFALFKTIKSTISRVILLHEHDSASC